MYLGDCAQGSLGILVRVYVGRPVRGGVGPSMKVLPYVGLSTDNN